MSETTINQCDGCRRGLLLVNGNHRGEGWDGIGCTADRYTAPEHVAPERGTDAYEIHRETCDICYGAEMNEIASQQENGNV